MNFLLPLAAAAAALQPSPAGVIDLPAIIAADEYRADVEAVPNPFRRHFHPQPAARELAVTLSGLVTAERDQSGSCVLNGVECEVGESFEGLRIARIDEAGVTLELAPRQLFVPLQDMPTLVKLPR